MRILITGGVKSGKSTQALTLASEFALPRYFLATAVAFDSEMDLRIKKHKAERTNDFITLEETIEIDKFLHENMILDCMTIWVNNLFYYHQEKNFEDLMGRIIAKLPSNIIIVTNEVGLGNIPLDPLTRQYNLFLARVNQQLAEACDKVIFMVSGLSLVVKESH